MAENTKVRCALHVVVAAEDVRSATGRAHVAKGELQDAVRTGVVVAVRVLRAAHAPDHGTGTVVGHCPRDALKLAAGCAGDPLDLIGCPLGDFGLDLIHAPDAGADEFLVFPAILENVPQDAPDQGNVRTGTEAYIFVSMGRCPGKARVAHDQRRIVLLFRAQNMQQRNGMRLGRVATDDEDRAAVVDVVIAVRHRTVAPGVCNTGHRGRVTDTRLVIHVVRAPVGGELAEEVGLFVVVLGRSQPVHAVRAAFVPDLHHAVADLIDRLFPADALPLATLFFHRVLEAAFAMGVLAHSGPFGAVGTEVERAVPAGFLSDPDAIRDFGDDRAADRAVGADGFDCLNGALNRGCGIGFGNSAARCADRGKATDGQTRSAQECAAIYRLFSN